MLGCASSEPVPFGEDDSSLSDKQILCALCELDLSIDVTEDDLDKLLRAA